VGGRRGGPPARRVGHRAAAAGRPGRLADYDPGWPALFEREAARIRGLLGAGILLLEHVGSTSVPGLAAKPVIDILMVVADPAAEDRQYADAKSDVVEDILRRS
jgi:GrpB-like predicted nucleotidyltransferase (UPF0157 family)